MKIAILGFGVEGHSAYEYWNSKDNQITICDQNESTELPPGVNSNMGPNYLTNLGEFDLIVRSPGIHPNEISRANSPAILDKVTTSTNEFFKVCPTTNIIGVTGTKGKGTTSTLITKFLEASGHRVHLGGNIGLSAIALLKENIQPDDWVVLELSSFQLIDLKYSPHIAVCLMLVPEHLNWHADEEEYLNSKKNIFAHQSEFDLAIYFADNPKSKKLAEASPGSKVPYYEPPGAHIEHDQVMIGGQVICSTSDIKLLGKHNWQNICAALTAYWEADQNLNRVREVIFEFHGLEHRLEFVTTKNSINYYNDSFASVPDATMAAIDAIQGPKVMIIGGFDRNLDLSNLANCIKDHDEIKQVLLIGASSQRVAENLYKVEFTKFMISGAPDMLTIVHQATSLAHPNDSIVLSPGFPSFDMFKNFEDRGNQYKQVG